MVEEVGMSVWRHAAREGVWGQKLETKFGFGVRIVRGLVLQWGGPIWVWRRHS